MYLKFFKLKKLEQKIQLFAADELCGVALGQSTDRSPWL